MLGARGWQTFWRITLPNIKWGLLYGVILCNARAMGEFGAVSVVSGHIRGRTNTMPLHVEILYNEYQFAAAFAVRLAAGAAGARHAGAQVRCVERRAAPASSAAPSERRPPNEHPAFATSTSGSATSPPLDNVDLDVADRRAARAARAVRVRARRRCCGSSPGSSRRPGSAILFHGEDATDVPRARSAGRLRVPALRAVPAHDRVREHRLRPARAPAQAPAERAEIREAGPQRCCELVQLDGWPTAIRTSSPAASGSASRWPARLPCEPQRAAARRAVRRARRAVRQELRRWLRRLHDEVT